MVKLEKHVSDFSEVLKKLGLNIETDVRVISVLYSDQDDTVFLELEGEVNFDISKIVKTFSEYLGTRVVFTGEKFKVVSLKSFLMEKLSNGLVFDVSCEPSRVVIRVPGEFAKDRIKSKIKSMKKEILKRFRDVPRIFIKVDEEFFKKLERKTEGKKRVFKRVKVEPEEIETSSENAVFGRRPRKEVFYPSSLPPLGRDISIMGEVFKIEERNGRKRSLLLYITDKMDSIVVRIPEKYIDKVLNSIEIGDGVIATGRLDRDPTMDGDPILIAKGLEKHDSMIRKDTSEGKRVELHAHSKYSDLDSVLDIEEYVRRASQWGHKAVALTDHGNVQGIPEFFEVAKKYGIKPIFGMEGYMVNDVEPIIHGEYENIPIDEASYVVVDLETTGLDPLRSEIIEIGALKIENGRIVGEYQTLVKPKFGVSRVSERITGITEKMLEEQPSIEEVMDEFMRFLGDSLLVAHNASFDYRFLRFWVEKITGKEFSRPYIDTLALSRALLTMSSYSLDKVASKLKLGVFRHHRALDDARITAMVFLKFQEMLKSIGINRFSDFEKLRKEVDPKTLKPYHVTILVKNKRGLKNLYKLVSESHVEYFHNVPKIPKSRLGQLREGLLIGSACLNGEVVRSFLDGANEEEMEEIMKFYDFIEIMPLDLADGREKTRMKDIYRTLYKLAKKLGIPVVMTGDVHFLDPEDEKIRMVLMAPQKDDLRQLPMYFRTTDEMLKSAFEIFEDEETAREIVVENTNRIADVIEDVKPIEKKLHPPLIEGSDDIVRKEALKRAHEIYGDPLPDLIEKRLERELKAIIGNGYSVLYLIAKKLVDKSKADGYVVGSRGSVGSSLVAYLLGITEVNPLPPHYVCPKCKYVEFDESVGSGYDLPDSACPRCGTRLLKNGQNIPFEVFMGFEGDKVPDIDLNFSGEYQDRAHRHIEDLFGKDHVYRAGTINTVASRSARGFVKSFEEKIGVKLRRAEFERLVLKVTGVKRTTGQHPGGLMIIPKDKEVYDFTPIQYPANDRKAGVLTTHFAYEHIHDDLVKIDALGHDDPTFIRYLKELTGVDPMDIPMDDRDTLKLFSSVEPLNLKPEDLGSDVGTYGIPEFGTRFVRGMLQETRPKSFADLVRISGLSHGTDVWLNNARDWINRGLATLSDVISCRDDIMNFLIQKGMNHSKAFKIMEKVRKGKGISEEDEEEMKKLGVPRWYIESCKKIKYLFPKAHAVAYVSMAFRIAYFKVHYPLAFYSAYFTIKGDEFNVEVILNGEDAIRKRLNQLYSMSDKDVQDKNEEATLEVALEMLLRGYGFLPPDIEKSDSRKFLIENGKLRIPFNKIPGLGTNVAESIVSARKEKPFSSIEDLVKRTKVNRSHLETLKRYGVLSSLPETDQFVLF